MKNFIQFNIHFEPFNLDIVSGAIWEFDILGINENDNFISVYVNEDSKTNKEQLKLCLQNLIEECIINSFEITDDHVQNKNWNEEWEKKVNVIEVSERIVIKPTFREYEPKENQIVLIIDPKMSFGTGEHQTTKLILLFLEKFTNRGDKVLDVGSGTAVLCIAASKLGADRVIGVDNDEWCYINGIENVERNNLKNVELYHGTISDIQDKDFDLVTANINKIELLGAKDLLYKKLKKNGLLILSGLLENDLREIKRQFTNIGLTALEVKHLDEWVAIVLKKD